VQDLRYGLRGLRRQPAFAALAILALALGIGSATTIFSVIQNVLLDPFPYTDAERVIAFQIRDLANTRPGAGGRTAFNVPEFLDYQSQLTCLDDVIAGGFEDVLYRNGEGASQFGGGLVSGNTFQFLGVPALVGRILTPEDAEPGAPPVFVMSHRLWSRHFSLDPSIVGRDFVLNNVPTRLVGVMPPRFRKLNADLYRPVRLERSDPEGRRRFFMFQAKLKRGRTLAQAEAEFSVVAQRLSKEYPDNYPKKFAVRAVSWVDSLVGPFRQTLYTLAAAVGLLLLIACANVANMLLARAPAREKEMAVRASLGAGRGRLVRQLLVESVLLALAGTLLGCFFAYFGILALVALIPDGFIPREAVIRLNVPVLMFSLGVAFLTAVVFGLMPALQGARSDLVEPLRDAGKGQGGAFRRGRLSGALVVIEVALSLVLLTGAGLLMRTFVKLQTVDLGFDPDKILVARMPLPNNQYRSANEKHQLFGPLLARIQTLPGVVAAAAASSLPPYGGIRTEIEVLGKTHSEKWEAIYQLVSEGYFPTLGLRVRRGRALSDVDVSGARKVAVVNELFVDKYLAGEDPVGQRVQLKNLGTIPEAKVEDPTFEIVGVVADVKNQGIQDPPMPEAFIPYSVTGSFQRGLLVRTQGDPEHLVNAVRREIWAIDRNVALTLTGSLTGYLRQFSFAGPRFSLFVLGVFAAVGLVLVGLGVFSVIAYTVSRQTREIGIRMAMGADRTDILRMVLRMGVRLVGLGLAIGLLASLAATRVLASQLWDVSPYDPLTLFLVIALVALVGLAACYFPALRATRVPPMTALRYE
jgi:putative ABC transport system permease protein